MNLKLKQVISFISLSLVSSVVLLTSCSKDSQIIDYGDFPVERGEIFGNKCSTSGCHDDKSNANCENFNMASFTKLFLGSEHGSSVIPYRSDFSTLCASVNTYPELGFVSGPTMPLDRNVLSKEEVLTIKNWINQGAPDKNGKVMWSENSNRKKYYVLNQGCDVVTVCDAETQLPIRYITVGNLPNAEAPHMIRISPDGNYWYVVFANNNILQKYRTTDDVLVGQVTLGVDLSWNTITISNDNKKAYCVSWQGNSKIAAVNLETMKVIHYNIGTTNAHGSALNKTNDTLYVTSQSGNFIYKVDTGFTMIPTQITLDMSGIPSNTPGTFDPHEILFSADGSKYFVTCEAANQVRVMNTSNDALVQVINTGAFPLEMVKSNAQQKLYVTCQDEQNPNDPQQVGCVTVIDMNSFNVTNYPVGFQPHGITLDETNGYVIVASRNVLSSGPPPHHTTACGRTGFVNYFKIATMELLEKETVVASDPYSLAIRP
jgi:DNA-binding beta-propeller fold protein YncE